MGVRARGCVGEGGRRVCVHTGWAVAAGQAWIDLTPVTQMAFLSYTFPKPGADVPDTAQPHTPPLTHTHTMQVTCDMQQH